MNTDEWRRTNKNCQRCKKHLYERLFSSPIYLKGELICPEHGTNYKTLEG
jgi:hypothetical protein